MTDLLFDPPFYLPAAFVLAAIVLLYSGNARQRRPLMLAGLAAGVIALLIVIAGRLVETDREKVLRETNELAARIDAGDWPGFGQLLDPQVRFAMYKGRDMFVAGGKKTVEQVGVKNIAIGSATAAPEPGGYVVTFTATADIGDMGRRLPTNWKLYWSKDGDVFRVYRVELLPDARFGTDPVMSRLATP